MQQVQAADPSNLGAAADAPKTMRQRQIEELKKSLLAPPPSKGPQGQAVVGGTLAFNRVGGQPIGGAPEGDKFNKVMDWGTPRLVTKNRALVMDSKAL